MTRKKAIEVIAKAATKCSWVPKDWKACAVTVRPGNDGGFGAEWGRAVVVGFFSKIGGDILREEGFTKRTDGGFNFTRKWLEKNKYLHPECSECGKSDETVYERACGYSEEINGTEVLEIVCDDCEHSHCMDI